MPSDPPKNTLLPKELLWRFPQHSNGVQVILTGGVGTVQISKKISTDAPWHQMSPCPQRELNSGAFASSQTHRISGLGRTLNGIYFNSVHFFDTVVWLLLECQSPRFSEVPSGSFVGASELHRWGPLLPASTCPQALLLAILTLGKCASPPGTCHSLLYPEAHNSDIC